MKPTLHRLTLVALLVTTATAALAPAARAELPWRRPHRGVVVLAGGPAWAGPRVVVRARAYDVGPAPVLAGLVGGFVLGAALAHAQPVVVAPPVVVREPVCAPPPPAYRYEDAYGDRWWDTLDECTQAACGFHGPRVIHVVEAGSDRLVRTLYWKHDHWISDDDDWDGR